MQIQKFLLKDLASGIVITSPPPPQFVPRPFSPDPATQHTPSETPDSAHEIPHAPPPPPTFTEADLKQSEQEGYRRGFLEGEKEGRNQADAEQTVRTEQLTAAADQLS